jgi:hypothetical protein
MILPKQYLDQFTHYEVSPYEGWTEQYTLVKLYHRAWWKPFSKKIKIRWNLRNGLWYESPDSLQLRDQLANYFYNK